MSAIPFYGVAYEFETFLEDTANPGKFKSSPTIATGDVKVKKDRGSEANITSTPTASGAEVQVNASATEMQAERVQFIFRDVAGDEWYDRVVTVHTIPCIAGKVVAGTLNADSFTTDLSLGSNDEINNAYIHFITGANKGLSRLIEDYTDSSGLIDINTIVDSAFPNAPSADDEFVIVGRRV